jgi:ethanolamine utilization protein EutA
MEINRIELLSVGIDVGSSTSHLVFSNLVLIRDEASVTQRFEIEDRDVIYRSQIIHTPLKADDSIDLDRLTQFLQSECNHAGIKPADIQTGAVIVTGETAKKHNAPQIAQALSNDAGKFVAATAGPNFESLLAAMGSGATAMSKEQGSTIISCDIGGGTANMAVSRNGEVLSTSCVSVGGRLLAVDKDGRLCRINDPARWVMEAIGLDLQIGDPISKSQMDRVTHKLAEVLIEVITGRARTPLARKLMVTEDLKFPPVIDGFSFSGGVAEFIYGNSGNFDDIGQSLANQILTMAPKLGAPIVEPINKIRATVIGAGAYSLSISGCSGFMDNGIRFPIQNVPVLRVDVEVSQLSAHHVVSQVRSAFQRFDLSEGQDVVALYFKDPVRNNYPTLELFAKSMETALPNSIKKRLPIILIFEKDVACSVGNVMQRETELNTNLLSLDELDLSEGDWIDISEPLMDNQVFPVTVKSLVFPMN